jgi:hypothetical protein
MERDRYRAQKIDAACGLANGAISREAASGQTNAAVLDPIPSGTDS